MRGQQHHLHVINGGRLAMNSTQAFDKRVLTDELLYYLTDASAGFPGVTGHDEVSRLESAIRQVRSIIKAATEPPPPTIDEALAAKIDATVADEIIGSRFEQHRIEAWEAHYAAQGTAEASQRLDKIMACWRSGEDRYELPEGLVMDGWPPDVAPEDYIRKEITARLRPEKPAGEPEKPAEEDDVPTEADVANTTLGKLLAAAASPGKRDETTEASDAPAQ